MGVHKLTAGDGYTYLTRQVAVHDGTDRGHAGLADYYAERGESPGRWFGAGLGALDLEVGSQVTETHMRNLFGEGRHPDAERLENAALDAGKSVEQAKKASQLGRVFARYLGNQPEFIQETAKRYIAYNLAFFCLTNGLILWRVAGGGGAGGYLGAQLIASALMAVVAVAVLLPHARPALAWAALAPMLAYSLPLVPHFLGHWGLGLADRAIVERYAGLEQLGLYTLAFQVGAVAQLAVTAGINALLPMFARAARDPAELARLPRAATYYALAAATVVLALALAAQDVLRLLTPPAYHAAGPMAVLLIIAAMPLALYYLPMNALAQTEGRTAVIPLLTLAAAAVSLSLTLLLAPRYGAMAAAASTVVGYSALLGLLLLLAWRRRVVAFEYGRIGKIVLALVISLGLGLLALRFGPLANLLLVPPLLLLLPLALTLLGFWRPEERA